MTDAKTAAPSGAPATGGPPRLEPGTAAWAMCEAVWDFHRVGQPPAKADGILCLCSHDVRVAVHAAELFKQGLGGWVLFSGGHGTGPHSGARLHGWTEPEAVIFARAAIAAGVPEDKVLVEPKAANTGENIAFSRALLAAQGIVPTSLLVVQKPFMERRSLATLQRQWGDGPLPTLSVSSPPLSFAEYPEGAEGLPRETLVEIMVGDLQRLRVYATPERDFQVPVAVPADVWAAYEGLVALGYTMNVLRGADGKPLA